MGGRLLNCFVVVVVVIKRDLLNFSQLSGISIMSVPAETYVFGLQIALLIPIMVFVVAVINKIFLPVFYHNHIANCYEVISFLQLKHS